VADQQQHTRVSPLLHTSHMLHFLFIHADTCADSASSKKLMPAVLILVALAERRLRSPLASSFPYSFHADAARVPPPPGTTPESAPASASQLTFPFPEVVEQVKRRPTVVTHTAKACRLFALDWCADGGIAAHCRGLHHAPPPPSPPRKDITRTWRHTSRRRQSSRRGSGSSSSSSSRSSSRRSSRGCGGPSRCCPPSSGPSGCPLATASRCLTGRPGSSTPPTALPTPSCRPTPPSASSSQRQGRRERVCWPAPAVRGGRLEDRNRM